MSLPVVVVTGDVDVGAALLAELLTPDACQVGEGTGDLPWGYSFHDTCYVLKLMVSPPT